MVKKKKINYTNITCDRVQLKTLHKRAKKIKVNQFRELTRLKRYRTPVKNLKNASYIERT